MRRYVKEFVLLTKECQQMKEYDLYKKKKDDFSLFAWGSFQLLLTFCFSCYWSEAGLVINHIIIQLCLTHPFSLFCLERNSRNQESRAGKREMYTLLRLWIRFKEISVAHCRECLTAFAFLQRFGITQRGGIEQSQHTISKILYLGL